MTTNACMSVSKEVQDRMLQLNWIITISDYWNRNALNVFLRGNLYNAYFEKHVHDKKSIAGIYGTCLYEMYVHLSSVNA